MSPIFLSAAEPSQYKICKLQGPKEICDRLKDLGFSEGEVLTVEGNIPFQGALIVSIANLNRIALRREEAHCMLVEKHAD